MGAYLLVVILGAAVVFELGHAVAILREIRDAVIGVQASLDEMTSSLHALEAGKMTP